MHPLSAYYVDHDRPRIASSVGRAKRVYRAANLLSAEPYLKMPALEPSCVSVAPRRPSRSKPPRPSPRPTLTETAGRSGRPRAWLSPPRVEASIARSSRRPDRSGRGLRIGGDPALDLLAPSILAAWTFSNSAAGGQPYYRSILHPVSRGDRTPLPSSHWFGSTLDVKDR